MPPSRASRVPPIEDSPAEPVRAQQVLPIKNSQVEPVKATQAPPIETRRRSRSGLRRCRRSRTPGRRPSGIRTCRRSRCVNRSQQRLNRSRRGPRTHPEGKHPGRQPMANGQPPVALSHESPEASDDAHAVRPRRMPAARSPQPAARSPQPAARAETTHGNDKCGPCPRFRGHGPHSIRWAILGSNQ